MIVCGCAVVWLCCLCCQRVLNTTHSQTLSQSPNWLHTLSPEVQSQSRINLNAKCRLADWLVGWLAGWLAGRATFVTAFCLILQACLSRRSECEVAAQIKPKIE